MMVVKQLRLMLAGLPDEMEVLIEDDPFGTSFSPIAGSIANCIYVKKRGGGDFYNLDWSADEARMSEGEWENVKASKPRVLILCPENK